MTVPAWLELLLIVLVISAAVTDLAIRKIPNLLLLVGWVAVLGLHFSGATPAGGMADSLGGAAIGFVLFLPLYALRGMAAGDVKLMATVGLFLGPAETAHACILAWCVGGVMGLVIIVFTRRWAAAYTNLRNLLLPILLRMGPTTPEEGLARPSVGSMPYGLAIALTTLWLVAQRHA